MLQGSYRRTLKNLAASIETSHESVTRLIALSG